MNMITVIPEMVQLLFRNPSFESELERCDYRIYEGSITVQFFGAPKRL